MHYLLTENVVWEISYIRRRLPLHLQGSVILAFYLTTISASSSTSAIMISTISSIALCVGLALAAPQVPRDSALANSATFSLTQFATDSAARAAAITVKRSTFQYGPSPIGDINYYPNGTLATAIITREVADLNADVVGTQTRILTDQPLSVAAIVAVSSIHQANT